MLKKSQAETQKKEKRQPGGNGEIKERRKEGGGEYLFEYFPAQQVANKKQVAMHSHCHKPNVVLRARVALALLRCLLFAFRREGEGEEKASRNKVEVGVNEARSQPRDKNTKGPKGCIFLCIISWCLVVSTI